MVGRRCVFLDRDGVINVKQPDDVYVTSWQQFEFLPAIVDWIRLFNALDYLVIVVTNQRGIARGLMSAADVEAIHTRMIAELAEKQARIDDVFYCPHDKNSCQCRKPAPGMVLAAQAKWNIDLNASLMIGDSDSDQQLAINCGLRFLRAFDGRIV
jgi:D-glycero-D-manno-heptose 1,7-bisphosphate phosphatase